LNAIANTCCDCVEWFRSRGTVALDNIMYTANGHLVNRAFSHPSPITQVRTVFVYIHGIVASYTGWESSFYKRGMGFWVRVAMFAVKVLF
jgi:hypothetical protein